MGLRCAAQRLASISNFMSIIKHPLFAEAPDLPLPVYMLVVSFGLIDISPEHGPIEIAPGTHRMPRKSLRSVAGRRN
jgi:hypothetical protein